MSEIDKKIMSSIGVPIYIYIYSAYSKSDRKDRVKMSIVERKNAKSM